MAGLAVDIRWNGVGGIKPEDRSGVVALAKYAGLSWGGDFKIQPEDESHHFYDTEPLNGTTRAAMIEAAQERYKELTTQENKP